MPDEKLAPNLKGVESDRFWDNFWAEVDGGRVVPA